MGETGLVELADGVHAWLQPRGGWGWSNAGLLVGDGASLLVDTLFDLPLTRAMLDAMAPLTFGRPIGTVVNTHANGDHCYGNQLVTGAEIVASAAAAAEMERVTPQTMAALLASADDLGDLGRYFTQAFGQFHFDGIELTPPTRTFAGELTLSVGGRRVQLLDVGPAHTEGDVIVHVPDADVVFTGDILFIGDTPLAWAGPVSHWIAACDCILGLGAATVVPGHGPLTDAGGVRSVRAYLEWLLGAASERHAAGMSAADAARDIHPGPFADWNEPERVAVNVDAVYRELDPTYAGADVVTLFGLMAELAAR